MWLEGFHNGAPHDWEAVRQRASVCGLDRPDLPMLPSLSLRFFFSLFTSLLTSRLCPSCTHTRRPCFQGGEST